MEVGTSSAWVNELLSDAGHDVLVANPRKLRFIFQGDNKHDRVDAEQLARVARLDSRLLSPIRSSPAQVHARSSYSRASARCEAQLERGWDDQRVAFGAMQGDVHRGIGVRAPGEAWCRRHPVRRRDSALMLPAIHCTEQSGSGSRRETDWKNSRATSLAQRSPKSASQWRVDPGEEPGEQAAQF